MWQVGVIFNDFEKAFDRVEHNILIQVFSNSWFGNPLLSWFVLCLSRWNQWENISGHKYEVSFIPSGVPQGGHLLPLLLTLFIDGAKEMLLNSNILAFPDNLKFSFELATNTTVSCCKMNLIFKLILLNPLVLTWTRINANPCPSSVHVISLATPTRLTISI